MKNLYKGIIVLVILAVIAGAGYALFSDEIGEWGEGVERISDWEKEYRKENPDASDAEVDAAFRAGMAEITIWMERYKQENPGATDADAEAAFNAAWGD